MQAVSTASLFQSAESELLGTHRSAKAAVVCESGSWRYGYPVQLDAGFDARALVSEGAGADGGRFRVLTSRVDQTTAQLWTAEAGGIVRQLDLETGSTINVYRGAQGPVPTLDLITAPAGDGRSVQWIVTGSWDKALRIYQTSPTTSKSASSPVVTIANAMDDFVKCLHAFPASGALGAHTMLAVGGSDKSVKVFDLTPALSAETQDAGQVSCVYQLKAHTRPVNAVASLVGLDGHTRVYSADSMGRILESTWDPTANRLHVQREILGFETAIYDLRVFWQTQTVEGQHGATQTQTGDEFLSPVKESLDGSLLRQMGVLWAASGDKTVAGYSLSTSAPRAPAQTTKRAASIAIQGTLPPLTQPFARATHPDYVKSVLPLSVFGTLDAEPMQEEMLFEHGVVTGASDDQLRFFPDPTYPRPPLAQGDDDADDDRSVYEIEGHWNEITSLEPWIRLPTTAATTDTDAAARALPPATTKEYWIVSAGLDGSIRRWNVSALKTFPAPRFATNPTNSGETAMDTWNADSLPTDVQPPTNGAAPSFQLTAEEEAELAELMDSD